MDLAPVPQEPTAGPEWDAFVERGGGRFAHAYHLTAWREVHRRAYGREPIYLGARGATGELLGGLPLVVHGGALRGLARNLWRNLAKARDRGVVVRSVGSRMDLWRFYRQYVVAMRRHRAVPRSWLEVRWAHRLLAPSRRCGAWLGEYRGEVVAGVMFLSVGDSIELLYGGSDPRANDVRPTHAVCWHAIEWAIANGKTVIDWGTAPVESSLGNFMRQWGAEPVDSFRYTYVPGAGSPQVSEPAEQQRPAQNEPGARGAAWDRVPVDALGVAATVAHRLL